MRTAVTPVTSTVNGQQTTIIPRYGTWKDFRDAFTKAFITADVEGEALRDLRRLKQEKDKGVESYIQRFQTLAARAGLTNKAAIEEYFTRGLRSNILEVLKLQLDRPESMEEWYTSAIKAEKNDKYYKDVGLGSTMRTTPTVAPVAHRGLLYVSGSQCSEFLNGILATSVPKPARGPFFTTILHPQVTRCL